MRSTHRVLVSVLLAALAVGCKKETEPGDTGDTDTDTDTGIPAFACPTDDPNEEDDALGTANGLTDGMHQDGVVCSDDADWYSLSAPAGCLAAATLTFGADAGDLDLVLYDAGQEPLDGSFFGETVEEVGWFNRTGLAQALYLEVTGYLGDEGTYAIKFNCTASSCTGDEAGEPDAPDDANALGADTSFEGKVCYGDSDWFEIPFGAGCDVDILLDYAAVGGDLDLFLYDAQGVALDASQSGDDDDELTRSNDGADTTLLAEVYGVELANNTYALSYTAQCPYTCPADDAQEPDDAQADPNALAEGVAQEAVVCADDADWYSFSAPPGCLAAATLTFGPGAGDLDLALYDGQQVRLDDSLFGETVEEVKWFNRTTSAQALYLEVTGYLSAEGTYAIGYECHAATCDGDEVGEPDSMPDDANVLAADTPFAGKICYGDSDWFEIPLAAGCDADILLDYSYVAGDLALYLYDAQGTRIDASESDDDDEDLTYANGDVDASVFVEVFGDDLANSTYALSYSAECPATCPADDPSEPDDTQADPNALAEGVAQVGIVCAADADWYAFSAPPGCLAAATLTFGPGAGDLDLALYDAQEVLLDESLFGASVEETHWFNRTASAQDLYLEVIGYLGAEGTYAIDYSCAAATCDGDEAGEPDSMPDDANVLAADTPFAGKICYGDSDWFELPLGAGCDADILLDYVHLAGDLDLYLYDAQGTRLDASESDDDDEELTYANGDVAASVFVEVFGEELANSTYALAYTADCPATCPADDAHEPNDFLVLAGPLVDGVQEDGIVCTNDADWYSFSAPPGCLADATLTFGPGAGDLDLTLYDAQAVVLDESFFGETVEETHWFNRTASAQALYLEVTGYLDAEGLYTIDYHCTAATCAGDEPGEPDARTDANVLTADTPFAGKICYGDSDWFRIPLAGRCDADILLDYSFAAGDLDLYLYNALGIRLDASESDDDDEELAYSNGNNDASVFVEVFGDELANSTYALSFTADCPATCPGDDEHEPNDTLAQSTPLVDGLEEEGIVCTLDPDVYDFSVPPGCLATAVLDFAFGADNLDLELFDPAGNLVNDSYFGANSEELQYYNPTDADQDLLLVVTGNQGDEGGYSLVYSCEDVECADEPGEPDALDDANLLPDETPFDGLICYGDSDWFEIPAGPGCEVDILVDFVHSNGDLDAYLYDAAGVLLDESLDSNNDEEFKNAESDGPLFVEVRSVLYVSNDYTISYQAECVPVCIDDPADDDLAAAATPITASPTPIDGQICVGDSDWYTFTLQPGCAADLTLDEASEDLDMLPYDAPDSHPLDFISREGATSGDPEHLRLLNAGAPKPIWLWVYAVGQDEESEYTLTYEETCIDCLDDNEEDDNQAQAKPLAKGVAFHGTACGDQDWFSITAAPGCDIDVDLNFGGPLVDLDLALRNTTTTVASGVSNITGESLLYTGNAAGGPYFIRVSPFYGISQYELIWTEVGCP